MEPVSPPASELAVAPEDRGAAIQTAAIAVFGEKGYHRATIKEIATRAGVAPGTIYLYFKNKRELLVSIADTLVTRTVSAMLSQAGQLDAEAFIAAIVRERLQFARQNAPLIRALVTEIWTDPELQETLVSQIVGPLFELANRHLTRQVEAGKLRSFRSGVVLPAFIGGLAALSLVRMGATEGFLGGLSEDEIVHELMSLYLYGLQPAGEEAQG